MGVDVVAALDLYVEQGQWDKCIETATKQVMPSSSRSQPSCTCSLAQSCISPKPKPQRCLINIKELSLPHSEVGVRGQARPGLHIPFAS